MSEHKNNLDGVEDRLLALRDAEQAGVFRRSKVQEDVLHQSAGSRTSVFRPFILPVAASVVLAVGIGSFMFKHELQAVREQREVLIAQLAAPDPCDGNFLNCFGKSTGALASTCGVHDYDHDGDVDLADFSSFQVTCDKPMRTPAG